MAEVLGDPVAMRFYPHPLSLGETRLWVSRNIARFEQDGLGLWATAERCSSRSTRRTSSRRVAERIGMTPWKTAEFVGRPHMAYAIRR